MTSSRPVSTTRQSIRNVIIGQAFGVVLEMLVYDGGVLALMILALGGGAFEVGLAATIMSGAVMMRILAAPRVDVRDRRRILLHGLTLGAVLSLGYLLFMPAERLGGPTVAIWCMLVVHLVVRCAISWGEAAWFPLIADMVPEQMRGRFFGALRLSWRATSTAAVLAAGWYLGSDPALWQFYPVLGIAIVGMFIRVVLMRRLPDFPSLRTGKPDPIVRSLRRPLGDQSFVRFMLIGMAVFGAQFLGLPFIVPYLNDTLGFPASWTMFAAAGLGIGQMLSLTRWGRLADRWGNRFVFLLGILLCAAAFGFLVVTPAWRTSPAAAFVGGFAGTLLLGIGSAGWQLAQTVRMLHVSPADQQGAYTAVFSMLTGAASAAMALMGGWTIDSLPDTVVIRGVGVETLRVYFSIVLGLVLATATLIRLLEPVREPGMRRVVAGLMGALPGPLSVPLAPLRMYLKLLDRARGDDGGPP